MITATVLTGCTGIEIRSDIINSWVAAYPNSNDVKLSMTYNCDFEYSIENISATDISGQLTNRYINITPENFNMTDVMCDGIYFINIEETLLDGTPNVETECIAVLCSTKCNLVSFFANGIENATLGDNVIVGQLYDSLYTIGECSDCRCQDACVIFNYITDVMNTTTNNASDCGCTSN